MDDGHNAWRASTEYQILVERPYEQSLVPFSGSNKFSIIAQTSSEKDYIDTRFNFQLKYPEDWYYLVGSDTDPKYHPISLLPVGKTPENAYPIDILVIENKTEQDYISNVVKLNTPTEKTQSQTVLGGLPASHYQIKHESASALPNLLVDYIEEITLASKYGNLYVLKCLSHPNSPCDFGIYNSILSSFKFTK